MRTENLEVRTMPRDAYSRLPYYPSDTLFFVLDRKQTGTGVSKTYTLYKGDVPVSFLDALSLIPDSLQMDAGPFRALAFRKGVEQPAKPSEEDFPFYKDLVNSTEGWMARPAGTLDVEGYEVWWCSWHWYNGDETNTLDSQDEWTEPVQVSGIRGKAFTYEDFTEEQIEGLMQPALEAAASMEELEEKVMANEEERIANEEERQRAEATRTEAEEARVEAEAARVKAEESRASAEEGRVKAETDRQGTWTELRTAVEEATEAAEQAAQAANLNTLAIVFDPETGKLDAVTGGDLSAFTSGEITEAGDVVLTFDY